VFDIGELPLSRYLLDLLSHVALLGLIAEEQRFGQQEQFLGVVPVRDVDRTLRMFCCLNS
jgi:hypothetical protein